MGYHGHGWAFALYQATVDELREIRRQPSHTPKRDRLCLRRLEDLYAQLSSKEREIVDQQGWRSWPDLYDLRQHPALDA